MWREEEREREREKKKNNNPLQLFVWIIDSHQWMNNWLTPIFLIITSHPFFYGCHKKQTDRQTRQKIISAGKNVEKLQLLCTVDGNVKWCSHCGKQHGSSSKKLKITLPYDSSIPLLRIHLKEVKAGTWTDICTPTFIAALWTQVSIRRWMDK